MNTKIIAGLLILSAITLGAEEQRVFEKCRTLLFRSPSTGQETDMTAQFRAMAVITNHNARYKEYELSLALLLKDNSYLLRLDCSEGVSSRGDIRYSDVELEYWENGVKKRLKRELTCINTVRGNSQSITVMRGRQRLLLLEVY
jgi:hypothetical protein